MMIISAFRELKDPRTGIALRHNLTQMIVMALCAILCGADNWVDVAEWAEDNKSWLKEYLKIKQRTPSHDTFSRVFRLIDVQVFENCFRQWIAEYIGAPKGVIAIDGKTLCGSKDGHNSALHMISAFATESGICIGQEATKGKGNELVGIKKLLETMMLRGSIVSIDAIGTQTDIAEKITEKHGDYLLAVKKNQGQLYDEIEDFFTTSIRLGFGEIEVLENEQTEKGHGRIEQRKAKWVKDISWMEKSIKSKWSKIAGVGMVEGVREINGKVSREVRYYIGTKGIESGEIFAHGVRSHWGIENQLHWCLDVIFKEDESRVRKGHGAQNMSVMRKLALTILRTDQTYKKRSLRNRRKTAERIPEYRANLLNLQKKF